MRTSNFGSLRIVPKDSLHIPGDGNDSTTTIYGKVIAMSQGIDLRSPAADSMRQHKKHVRWITYGAWTTVVVAVGVLALRWMTA